MTETETSNGNDEDNGSEEVPLQPPVIKDRLTQRLDIYHEHQGENPTHVTSAAWRHVDIEEQPYSRRLKVGTDWQPLLDERCWIAPNDVGVVVVENLKGSGAMVRPTDEEQESIEAAIIEICTEPGPCLLVRPGFSQPMEWSDVTNIFIRCRKGDAPYRLTVFPK